MSPRPPARTRADSNDPARSLPTMREKPTERVPRNPAPTPAAYDPRLASKRVAFVDDSCVRVHTNDERGIGGFALHKRAFIPQLLEAAVSLPSRNKLSPRPSFFLLYFAPLSHCSSAAHFVFGAALPDRVSHGYGFRFQKPSRIIISAHINVSAYTELEVYLCLPDHLILTVAAMGYVITHSLISFKNQLCPRIS